MLLTVVGRDLCCCCFLSFLKFSPHPLPLPSLLSCSSNLPPPSPPPLHLTVWVLYRAVSPWLSLPSSTYRSEGRPGQMVGASLWVRPTSHHWVAKPLNRLSLQLVGTGPFVAACWEHTCCKTLIPHVHTNTRTNTEVHV